MIKARIFATAPPEFETTSIFQQNLPEDTPLETIMDASNVMNPYMPYAPILHPSKRPSTARLTPVDMAEGEGTEEAEDAVEEVNGLR